MYLRGQQHKEKREIDYTYEPWHVKTDKMSVRPANTQISLGTRPVWSVFAARLMGS